MRGKSGFFGVFWDAKKQRFRARIRIGEKLKSLGYFNNAEEAAQAYDAAARAKYGDDAGLNFPGPEERGVIKATARNGKCEYGHASEHMYISADGKRTCRICNRVAQQRRRARLDTVQRIRHMRPARAMILEEELDPEDDEDILDPIDEPDSLSGEEE